MGEGAYFGSDRLTLADIVAGTAVPILPSLGVSLKVYPRLRDWTQRLRQRTSWQQTEATPEEVEAFKSSMKRLIAKSA